MTSRKAIKAFLAMDALVAGSVALAIGGVAIGGAGAVTVGCPGYTPNPKVVPDAIQTAICVYEHDTLPIAEIVKACGLDAAQTAIDLLAARDKAVTKRLAAMASASASPSGSTTPAPSVTPTPSAAPAASATTSASSPKPPASAGAASAAPKAATSATGSHKP
jgi:hypothetical protein